MELRDRLLDSLKPLTGSRHFHLHVLVSSPRKHSSLFPYATARQRVFAQDILILCSEQPSLDAPRVLVAAIEAAVYHVPSASAAILYVAKVDSTGQGARPAPTASLVRTLLVHYAHPAALPATRCLWVHLFARAERQYLFPNSADHPAKHPLGDAQLCAWWKRILTRVAREVGASAGAGAELPRLYYVLPGMSELEAMQALGETSVLAGEGPRWIYGHPYSQKELPLPYASKAKDAPYNLGQCIPSFDDDPKSRFLDEIACTTQTDGLVSPKRKRRKTSNVGDEKTAPGVEKRGKEKDRRVHGELGIVSTDEFWERMSFRQECVAGAVTGFFVAVFSGPSKPDADELINPLAPQPGQVSHHMIQRIVTSLLTGHEFSTTERTVKATEILEASIKGLCGGLHAPTCTSASSSAARKTGPFLADADEETSPSEFLAPPQTPPSSAVRDEEPQPSTDTYESYIYGAVAVTNADLAANADSGGGPGTRGGVTVLAVRKKKRK